MILAMRWPGWLGVGERRWRKSPDEDVQPPKTLWDLVQLLVVPVLLVVIALSFNASQASRDRSRDEEARREATLDSYFVQMSDLMLDGHLLNSKERSPVRQVARTITLATVRRLDGRRKGEDRRFLSEAGLLDGAADYRSPRYLSSGGVVSLSGADLRGVDLASAVISPSPLHYVNSRVLDTVVVLDGDLRGAIFDDAILGRVYFADGVGLSDASFKRTSLFDSDLPRALLEDVSFNKATLDGVNLRCANLERATFDGAHIERGTFESASLDNASFVGAEFNVGAYDPRLTGPRRTSFADARGGNVDFSDAENLSSVDLPYEDFDRVRIDGDERPKPVPPDPPVYPC